MDPVDSAYCGHGNRVWQPDVPRVNHIRRQQPRRRNATERGKMWKRNEKNPRKCGRLLSVAQRPADVPALARVIFPKHHVHVNRMWRPGDGGKKKIHVQPKTR